MNEPKFTPAPWYMYETLEGDGGAELLSDAYNGVYAKHGYLSDDPKTGFGLTGCITKDDARLMAAAPEMYDALVFIKGWFSKLEDDTEDGDPLKAIRQRVHAPIHAAIDTALAKAVKP